ncbi:MAG: hypothetical protein EOO61_14025 [Hymenobacter sp.]|nr:MAG: hypothetical protein EOO61_14025 [Hymenobacter sp.]
MSTQSASLRRVTSCARVFTRVNALSRRHYFMGARLIQPPRCGSRVPYEGKANAVQQLVDYLPYSYSYKLGLRYALATWWLYQGTDM